MGFATPSRFSSPALHVSRLRVDFSKSLDDVLPPSQSNHRKFDPSSWRNIPVVNPAGPGIAGVALLVWRAAGGLDASRILGDLLALGAAAAWSWYGFAVRPVVAAAGTWQATGWAMGIAMLLFAPLGLSDTTRHTWAAVSWPAWAGLVYGGTAGMVLAMALWGRSLHRFGQRQTMVYVYLEPVSAVVIAAVLLGESLSAVQAAGALLTFAGVWLASDRS